MTCHFNDVKSEEHEWTTKRRCAAKLEPGCPEKDACGLALSGGGVRSATFNLGLLQALDRHDILHRVDYLSTVSGGGFIGSALTWYSSTISGYEPPVNGGRRRVFGTQRSDVDEPPWQLVRHIRDHSEYLTPTRRLNRWVLFACIIRATLFSLLAFVPIIVVLFLVVHALSLWLPGLVWSIPVPAVILIIVLLVNGCWLQWRPWQPLREAIDIRIGRALQVVAVTTVLVSFPYASSLFDWMLDGVWTQLPPVLSAGIGIVSMVLGSRTHQPDNETRGSRGVLLHAGLLLVSYALLLWFYWLGAWIYGGAGLWNGQCTAIVLLVAAVAVISLPLLLWVDVNELTMFGFYRDRLTRAYMTPPNQVDNAPEPPTRVLRLEDLRDEQPWHIINANVVTVNSDEPRYRLRCGDSFIFTPTHAGSEATGYRNVAEYMPGGLDLATACAISGAAVASYTRFTRARAIALLMTLLNLSLSYWVFNPGRPTWRIRDLRRTGFWPALWWLFGRGLHENDRILKLTDGGHFENLGLYELVRRRCRLIIVSDASADPGWKFADLSNAIQKVRVDFGAAIDIDTRDLQPRGDNRISRSPFVVGRIRYLPTEPSDRSPPNPEDYEGTIIYIKTCVIHGLPEDIYGYRRDDPAFPDTPTTHQFFDEAQFEAYRELGFRLGETMVRECSPFLEQLLPRPTAS